MPDVYQSVFDQVENETAKIGLEMIGTCVMLGRCGRSERTWLLNFGVSQPLVGAFKPAQRQQFYGCLSVFRAAEWKQETHT